MAIKQLLLSFLICSLMLSQAFARNGAGITVSQKDGISYNFEIGDVERLANGFALSEIQNLTGKMCNYLVIANSTGNQESAGIKIEDYILEFNGWTRETDNYQVKFSEFWNKYSEHFICTNHLDRYEEQHFFMRVIDMQMYTPVLVEFLLKDETIYPIDVNVVQDLEGQRDTVLDFVDSIINDPSIHSRYEMSEIREIREILVTFYNAKHAEDL